ncbi:MAG: SOS response-associated peptidase, partial [Myxococcales bacterium]
GDRRVLVPAMWGYLASASSRLLINVRGEQVASGGGFRRAFDARRCVMVTDGFFEWDQRRMPYWYHRPDGGLILMAGLSQAPGAKEQTGPRFPRFTVLTTRPNQVVAQVHNRMPVIIPPDRLDLWLTAEPAAASRLIAPAPDEALVATAVSRRVNSVKNDDPGCLTPAAPTDAPPPAPPRQGSLF